MISNISETVQTNALTNFMERKEMKETEHKLSSISPRTFCWKCRVEPRCHVYSQGCDTCWPGRADMTSINIYRAM